MCLFVDFVIDIYMLLLLCVSLSFLCVCVRSFFSGRVRFVCFCCLGCPFNQLKRVVFVVSVRAYVFV